MAEWPWGFRMKCNAHQYSSNCVWCSQEGLRTVRVAVWVGVNKTRCVVAAAVAWCIPKVDEQACG